MRRVEGVGGDAVVVLLPRCVLMNAGGGGDVGLPLQHLRASLGGGAVHELLLELLLLLVREDLLLDL